MDVGVFSGILAIKNDNLEMRNGGRPQRSAWGRPSAREEHVPCSLMGLLVGQ